MTSPPPGQEPGYPAGGYPAGGYSGGATPPPAPAEMGPVTTQFARLDPGPSQTYGVFGAALVVVGAIVLALSFSVLDWYDASASHFSDVHTVIKDLGSLAAGPAKIYFGWLAWVLAVVAVVAALVAVAPTIGGPLRVVAPIVALAGVVVTFFAVQFVRSGLDPTGQYNGYGSFLKHARFGFWGAVVGFLLVGLGALLGPQNRRD